ncbi:MAG: enoyl-CoA hydratase [Pseudooceanicola sp.]
MSAENTVLSATVDRITTITLNRPERMNGWTREMAAELHAAVIKAGNDPACRVIVITGAGRGFCAGVDMAGLQNTAASGESTTRSNPNPSAEAFDNAAWPDLEGQYPGRFGYFMACPKPIIAAINGACAGMGLSLVLHCDLRYAAAEAKFSTAFAARGLIAEHGLAWLLPRLIGEANALDILMTARKFDGVEAADMGLLNAAVAREDLMDRVGEMARALACDVSPRSVAVIKRQVRAGYHQTFRDSLALADREMDASIGHPDIKEGVSSYVERRPPNFSDI